MFPLASKTPTRLIPIAKLPTASLRSIARDASGNAAVLVGVLLPVMIGGMGLGAETGYWFLERRELQHAVDASVHAAAVRRRSGDDEDAMRVAALDVAEKAGFSEAHGSLDLHWPALTGPSAGDPTTVEVVLSRTVPRIFSAIFSDEPVTMHARAVARVTLGSDACVLALAPAVPGALRVASSASVELECDAASDSMEPDSFTVEGNGALSAHCASTVGGADINEQVTLAECETVREYAAVVPDPYRDVAEPSVPSTCNSNNRNLGNPNTTTTVSPSSAIVSGMPVYRFCNGLALKGTVTFNPGLYIISGGDLEANAGAVINGTGVTFYIANPNKVQLNGHAELHLEAPTSGELSGILFFASRNASSLVHRVNGTSGSILQGAIYAPTTSVDYTGDSSTGGGGGCTQIIAYTVSFSGNSGLASSCEDAGTRDMKVNESVLLTE
jgi:hypothetical protein